MNPPCCAECAEFNAAGCPGSSPHCITADERRAAEARIALDAAATLALLMPGDASSAALTAARARVEATP